MCVCVCVCDLVFHKEQCLCNHSRGCVQRSHTTDCREMIDGGLLGATTHHPLPSRVHTHTSYPLRPSPLQSKEMRVTFIPPCIHLTTTHTHTHMHTPCEWSVLVQLDEQDLERQNTPSYNPHPHTITHPTASHSHPPLQTPAAPQDADTDSAHSPHGQRGWPEGQRSGNKLMPCAVNLDATDIV